MNTQHTPKDREGFIAAIAHKLAELDGYDDDSLFQLRWSGGTEPEPLGDAFSIDYLPKAERLMEVIDLEINALKQQLDELAENEHRALARIAELEKQHDALQAVLYRYGQHDSICLIRIDPQPGNCDCGFDAAMTDAAIAKTGQQS